MIVPGQTSLSQRRYAKFHANSSVNSRQEMKAVHSTANHNNRYTGKRKGEYFDSRNKIQVVKSWNVNTGYPNLKTRDHNIKIYH